MNFKVGDLVRLKSGSPLMVVHRLLYDNQPIECIYFHEKEFKIIEIYKEALNII